MVALTSLVVVVKYEEIQFPKAVKHVYCALAVGFPGSDNPKFSCRSVCLL